MHDDILGQAFVGKARPKLRVCMISRHGNDAHLFARQQGTMVAACVTVSIRLPALPRLMRLTATRLGAAKAN